MIVLATDYGCCSPYQAQLVAAIKRYGGAENLDVISLFSDLPAFRADLSAYLLPQYFDEFPRDSVFVFVVDPGVGSLQREPLVVRYQHTWIVCAGDDLLKVLGSRQHVYAAWRIVWKPPRLSKSFHGRDLFAPVAASLALGEWQETWFEDVLPQLKLGEKKQWPKDRSEIVYFDRFGNAMTGIRASTIESHWTLRVGAAKLQPADVFASVDRGQCFFYVNSVGLIEIAANQDSAKELLSLDIGMPVGLNKT